jgi:chromosome segregation ATPase
VFVACLTGCGDTAKMRTEAEIEAIAHDAAADATGGSFAQLESRISDLETANAELESKATEADSRATEAEAKAISVERDLEELRSEYETHRHY